MMTLIDGARVQARVIWALMIRELHTRFGRENIGFLWIMAEPALFAVGVSAIWSFIHGSHEHGIGIVAFVITGYIPLVMWRSCFTRATKAFEANGALMFHRQVTPIDIIVARTVLEIYGCMLAAIFTFTGAIMLGFMDVPYDFGLTMLGFCLQGLFSFATALICAGLSEMSDTVERVVPVLGYLAIPFSGTFTMVDWLPPGMRPVLLWSPSVNAVEIFRSGVFGPTIRTHYDVSYTVVICLTLILVGLVITKMSRKYILVQ
jgi:capsular polysaccharide transport system permease protein